MMAVLVSSRTLLLVLLTGATYSYPIKKGFDSSSSYSSNYGANPDFASTGSNWEVPSSSSFAPAAPGSASMTALSPAHPQTTPGRGPNYYQPSVQREPAASHSSNSLAQPAPSGSASSSPAGSALPSSFQPALKDIAWAVAPPSPFSGEGTSGRPGASRLAPRKPAPLGPSNVSPPGPFPPEFQAGELSHMENSYEHGNYESETEEQGFQSPPLGVQVSATMGFTSEPHPPGPHRGLVGYPHYDYRFLTGQYPPGTFSHYSSSFEQGSDNWQDTHYIRDYYPSSPGTLQATTFPTDSAAPQIWQPSQPTKGFERQGYGQGGATTGQAHPGVSLQGPFSQPSWFVPPYLSSPGGGYSTPKIGY